ncbi:MAG: class I SAM-dependent methyltransferase [Elusimicrobiota bacterium]
MPLLDFLRVGHLKYSLYELTQKYIHGDYAKQRKILLRELETHAARAPGRAAPRVLELACGGGSLAGIFPPDIYLGIDASTERVKAARLNHPEHHFEACDVTSPGFDAHIAGADFIFCHGLLHHIDDASCRALVLKSQRLAKKPATFVVIEPLLAAPWENPGGYLVAKMDEGYFFRTAEGYRDFFRDLDLRLDSFSLFPRLPLQMEVYIVRFD